MSVGEAARSLLYNGYVRLPDDVQMAAWARSAATLASQVTQDKQARAVWLRCAGTWFAGVDVLDNDASGAVGGTPLPDAALSMIEGLGWQPESWHRAQVSTVYPGYPQPREGESDVAARYRQRRDAAHVDGLLPVGPARHRVLAEPHSFILGIPLNRVPAQAGPLVVWQGSHRIMGDALRAALSRHPEHSWPNLDLTEAYRAARRTCFETCRRVCVPAQPGEATLLHRHLLHGMSPWDARLADTGGLGRMVAYFRPQFASLSEWIGADRHL